MNKCIRQNWKIFNKIRFAPIKLDEPDDLSDINEWAERVYNHLVDDDLKRHCHYSVRGRKGFTITVWDDGQYVYLVQVIRSEYNTDETMIYAAELTEENLNDFKAMAKFIRYNIKEIIGHSKEGVKALNQMKVAAEIKKEFEDGVDGQA